MKTELVQLFTYSNDSLTFGQIIHAVTKIIANFPNINYIFSLCYS